LHIVAECQKEYAKIANNQLERHVLHPAIEAVDVLIRQIRHLLEQATSLPENETFCPFVRPQITIAPRDLCVAFITKKDQGDENEYNEPLIPAGSKLPCQATECFTPIVARTRAVQVKLYDGHAGELSKNCTPLQEAEVEVQPTDEANTADRIEFKIHMDAEGLVHIDVRDKLLNRPVPIKFKFHTGLSDSDVEEARKQLLARHDKPEI